MDIKKLNPVIVNDEIDWQATGARDGKDSLRAEADAKEGLIGKLLELAECFSEAQHGGNNPDDSLSPACESWLKGYGLETSIPRKSEAKAVFDAYRKDQDQVETASLEVVGNGVGTKSRYHAFIEKCRDIRGRQLSRTPQGSRKVSAAQVDAAVKNAALMDGTQAAQVLQVAAQRVVSLHMPEILIVRQIRTLAEGLRNNTEKPEFKAYAAKCEEAATKLIDKIDLELAKAKAKASEVEASKGIVPTPAMQGKGDAPEAMQEAA